MNNLSIFVALAASAMILFVVVFVLVKDWRDQVMRYFACFRLSALGILFTMFLTYAFPDYFDLTQLNRDHPAVNADDVCLSLRHVFRIPQD